MQENSSVSAQSEQRIVITHGTDTMGRHERPLFCRDASAEVSRAGIFEEE
jgi:hypothetical protein